MKAHEAISPVAVRQQDECVSCDVVLQRGFPEPVHVSSLKIKRDKGIWWMPWHQKAMKDVALCEKFRGIESKC